MGDVVGIRLLAVALQQICTDNRLRLCKSPLIFAIAFNKYIQPSLLRETAFHFEWLKICCKEYGFYIFKMNFHSF